MSLPEAPAKLDLRRAQFVTAAAKPNQLPPDSGREVAFAGRSNAGKSSALNAITGRRALARVSKTPGRTQQLVVFDLGNDRRLVDLPGYGYAKVPEGMQRAWQKAMERYFRERQSLVGLILIMDVRHPLREYDWQMLHFCQAAGLAVNVLLSKADKLKRGRARDTSRQVRVAIAEEGIAATVQLFSSLKLDGVDEARGIIEDWLIPPPSEESL